METILSMSNKELSRLEIMQRLAKRQMSQNVFHKQAKQSEVVLAKDLNKTINTKSAPLPHKPAPDHPWHIFNLSKKSR